MARSLNDEKRCTAIAASGQRCGSARVLGGATCLAHRPDAKARGFSVGGGRTATPTVTQRLLQRVDERVDEILAAYFDSLAADDPELRMKAADRILNRALGTPKQSVDVAHSGGLSLEALLSPDPLTPTNSELPEGGE